MRALWLGKTCGKPHLLSTCSKFELEAARYRHARLFPTYREEVRSLARPFFTSVRRCVTVQPLQPRSKASLPPVDTVYALSTAPGRAAIAIIRITGPACFDIYGGLCPDKPFPNPRQATLRKLKDPTNKELVLDTAALVLYFPAPATVTGEDILELHVHGGPAIVKAILAAIPRCIDSRPRRRSAEYSLIRAAEPGEFTKRAFYNGRLELTEAEALGDSLAAETEQQRRLAVLSAHSGLAARYEQWRLLLLHARGELEALIDFSEDQHFDESPASLVKSVTDQVADLRYKIYLHIRNADRGELLRNGISIALLGAPNAGKSSLLNLLVGREAAIVNSEPGTTRDIVDVSIDISGWLVRLGDMAGLRPLTPSADIATNDAANHVGTVELEGMKRARDRAMRSDLVVVIIGISENVAGHVSLSLNTELIDAVRACQANDKEILFVINKADLILAQDLVEGRQLLTRQLASQFPFVTERSIFFMSCKEAQTGMTALPSRQSPDHNPGNIDTVLQGLSQKFRAMTAAVSDQPASGRTQAEAQSYWTASLTVTHRQSTYLQGCLGHLDDFLFQYQSHGTGEPRGVSETDPNQRPLYSHHTDHHNDLVGEIQPYGRSHVPRHCRDAAMTHLHDLPLNADTSDPVDTGATEVDLVTAAEHLRYAANCLAKITGRGEGGDVEDVLGVVFEK